MNMQEEPARIIGIITAFVTTVIALAVAFGVEMSQDQQNAIFAFIPASYAMIALVVELTRSRVSSPATVQRLKETGGRG